MQIRKRFITLVAMCLASTSLAVIGTASPSSAEEELPVVSISGLSVLEQDTGQHLWRVYFNLSSPAVDISDRGFGTVRVTTRDGTAKVSDRDYRRINRRVRWGPGVTSRFLDFRIVGDAKFEPDETFEIVLSQPSKVATPQEVFTFTILNNDRDLTVVPEVSIGDATVIERDSGIRTVRVPLTLDVRSPGRTTINVSTMDGTATVADGDYRRKTLRVLFGRNQKTKMLSFQIRGDRVVEADEQFNIVLSNPVGLTVADGTGVITIVDND